MIRKILLTTLLAGLVTIGCAYQAGKAVIHNVMSHSGWREGVVDIRKPRILFTRGHYKGFHNMIFYQGANESMQVDPLNYASDPLGKLKGTLQDVDLNAVYLGLEDNPLPKSNYRPTRLTGADEIDFYSIADFFWKPERLVGNGLGIGTEGLKRILDLKEGEVTTFEEAGDIPQMGGFIAGYFTNVDLGVFTLSFGRDEKGLYTSVYDVWDFAPKCGFFKENVDTLAERAAALVLPIVGNPIHFYDRVYWTDHLDEDVLREQISPNSS